MKTGFLDGDKFEVAVKNGRWVLTHLPTGYDKDGKLLGFYPATIGSTEKPAPSCTFEVRRVA